MSNPLVIILMATFNGERYLCEQLNSIAAQSYTNWMLIISDDGSSDQTLEILRSWAIEVSNNRVQFRSGPRQGFAQNFLSMACDPAVKADFYAFCDQDDIWCKDKLKTAIEWLQSSKESSALLYCGRTSYIRDDLRVYARSTLFKKPPSFRNALIQSIAGGNTMLFNHSAKELLEGVGLVPAVSHDWWIYQLLTGAGGKVYFDPQPMVFYRQHQDSLKGENRSLVSRLKRLRLAMRGELSKCNEQNLLCLRKAYSIFNSDCRRVIDELDDIRTKNVIKRLYSLKKSGIYRQGTLENLALFFLTVFRKL